MFIDLIKQEELNIRQQSFSGTDLNTDTSKMGIVYSFKPDKATDKQHTVSSIIDHHNNDICLIKHTEARSVECNSDDEVKYIKNTCIAVEINEPEVIFDKPIVVAQTPYKLRQEIKERIIDLVNTYMKFETKMFVYEKNITNKHSFKGYFDDYGYYEPKTPKKVLSKEIVNDFKSNIREILNGDGDLYDDKLCLVQEALDTQKLILDLFPKSKAKAHKTQILKDIKENKYTTKEVFDELTLVFNLVISTYCNY